MLGHNPVGICMFFGLRRPSRVLRSVSMETINMGKILTSNRSSCVGVNLSFISPRSAINSLKGRSAMDCSRLALPLELLLARVSFEGRLMLCKAVFFELDLDRFNEAFDNFLTQPRCVSSVLGRDCSKGDEPFVDVASLKEVVGSAFIEVSSRGNVSFFSRMAVAECITGSIAFS